MKRRRDGLPASSILDAGLFCGRRIETRSEIRTPAAADHELIRIGRREATCSCGLWNARSNEGLQTEITKTLKELHDQHMATTTDNKRQTNRRGENE